MQKSIEFFGVKSRVICEGDNLVELLFESMKNADVELRGGDIVCIVSKVVALTERRVADEKEMDRLIVEEAEKVYKRRSAVAGKRTNKNRLEISNEVARKSGFFYTDTGPLLTLNQGILTPSAGIDHSNALDGKVILWPKNAFDSAEKVRERACKWLKKNWVSKQSGEVWQLGGQSQPEGALQLGVLIFDSFLLPLRRGISGVTLGYSGFHGVEDCRGRKDIYGRELQMTQRNIADCIAAGATLLTGEADECVPFVVCRGAQVEFTEEKIVSAEIQLHREECIYGSVL